MDKKFLRYSMLFHRGPTSPPPMAAFAVNAVPHSMLDLIQKKETESKMWRNANKSTQYK